MSVAPRHRAALAFIYVTVLLDMLAFGIIIPVLPHLIEQLAGGGIAKAAWWVGIFSTVFAIVQFVFSPVQGALSDRFGRRRYSGSRCARRDSPPRSARPGCSPRERQGR